MKTYLWIVLAVVGCGGQADEEKKLPLPSATQPEHPEKADAGVPSNGATARPDAAVPATRPDAATLRPDAAVVPVPDAAVRPDARPPADAAVPRQDATIASVDAALPRPDAAAVPPDAAPGVIQLGELCRTAAECRPGLICQSPIPSYFWRPRSVDTFRCMLPCSADVDCQNIAVQRGLVPAAARCVLRATGGGMVANPEVAACALPCSLGGQVCPSTLSCVLLPVVLPNETSFTYTDPPEFACLPSASRTNLPSCDIDAWSCPAEMACISQAISRACSKVCDLQHGCEVGFHCQPPDARVRGDAPPLNGGGTCQRNM